MCALDPRYAAPLVAMRSGILVAASADSRTDESEDRLIRERIQPGSGQGFPE